MPLKKKSKITAKSECTDEPQGSCVDEVTGANRHRKVASPAKKAKMSTTSRPRPTNKVASSENDQDSHEKVDKVQRYWLMKAEPESRIENGVDVKFGIDDLMKEPNQTACWDGVRNYQARNFMRDQMSIGDLAFFYHSNCKPPGLAGLMTIVKEGYVDHTQFDKKSAYYDPKSVKDNPKWFMVDVKFKRKLKRYVPLPELKKLHLEHKENNGPLKNVALFTRARLSVQPLTKEEFEFMVHLENSDC